MRTRIRLIGLIAAVAAGTLGLGVAPAVADGSDLPFTTVPVAYVSSPIVGQQSTANTLAWSPQPDSFSYQWYFDGAAIDGATAYNYTPSSADLGGTLSATIVAHKGGFADTEVDAPAQTVLGFLDHTAATIGGTAEVGHTLTVQNDAWTPPDAKVEYHWIAGNGTPLAGPYDNPSYTITSADQGDVIRLQVIARLAGYASVTENLNSSVVAPDHLIPAPVTITGTARVGSTLTETFDLTAWTPRPSAFTYQWNRDGVAIPAATDLSYVVVPADQNHSITVTATGALAGYAPVSVTSAPTPVVAAGAFTIPVPTITGAPVVGHSLAAHTGAWKPRVASLSYTWYVNGRRDSAQNNESTYFPTVPGAIITVAITGWSSTGQTATSRQSLPTAPVAVGTIHAPNVSIEGSVAVNLVADGAYSGASPDWPSTHSWYVGGKLVSTQWEYTPTAADWNHTLRLGITLSVPGFAPVTGMSKSVRVHAGWFTGAPSITQPAQVGTRLTIDMAAVSPKPAHQSVRWYLGTSLSNARVIGTSSSFVPSSSYVGKHIFATVHVTGSHVESETVHTHSVIVQAAPFSIIPTPTIAGSAVVGQTLSADRGTWQPSTGVTYSYQWIAQGSGGLTFAVVPGATKSTITIPSSLVGAHLFVKVTASKSGYLTSSTISLSTAVVAAGP